MIEPERRRPSELPAADLPAADLQRRLEAVRLAAEGAVCWLESSSHYAALINSDGFVPVTAKFDARDLAFLGSAREQLLGFAELGLRLVELHRPLDAGGITTDPASPILRCRSCMWRWPCPTFRTMAEVMGELPPQLLASSGPRRRSRRATWQVAADSDAGQGQL